MNLRRNHPMTPANAVRGEPLALPTRHYLESSDFNGMSAVRFVASMGMTVCAHEEHGREETEEFI